LVALIAIPAVLACIFLLPSPLFLLFLLIAFTATAMEYARLVRHWIPGAPTQALLVLVPLTILALGPTAPRLFSMPPEAAVGALAAALTALVIAAILLGLRTSGELEQAAPTMGFLTFSPLYFSLPAASVYHLQARDPWLVLLLCAIVWAGDSAAYYVGSSLGRRKMSPLISPNKTWEGALGGLAASVLLSALWSLWRQPSLDPKILLLAAATAVAAQFGDLAESAVKRGAGVKDSSTLIPGHGGLYDRLDAMLLAAPVFFCGLWLIG
jgi:phosphatidate cytidylyltransferase